MGDEGMQKMGNEEAGRCFLILADQFSKKAAAAHPSLSSTHNLIPFPIPAHQPVNNSRLTPLTSSLLPAYHLYKCSHIHHPQPPPLPSNPCLIVITS